jgi:acyl carrier protein
MDEKAFLKDMEELVEATAGSLDLSVELRDLEQWNSLAFISFLAMADSNYNAKVGPSELRGCQTIADLMNLVSK